MKSSKFIATLLFSFTLVLSACIDEQQACTNEFTSIGLSVYGEDLDDFYTIRLKTNDTIHFENYMLPDDSDYYTVIDDNFQSKMVNQFENFRFIGIINDSVVVNEVFYIKADQCHVKKLNGVESVTL